MWGKCAVISKKLYFCTQKNEIWDNWHFCECSSWWQYLSTPARPWSLRSSKNEQVTKAFNGEKTVSIDIEK